MLSSLFQSPKSILATKLAEILSVYFEINAKQIQTNLIHDTKICLSHLSLKPMEQWGCLIVGSVKKVEFTWTWGGDDRTPFIRECFLNIDGVDIQVLIQDAGSGIVIPSTTKTEVDFGVYAQQIIDHLTLRISNLKLSLTLPDGATIVVGADAMELLSMGRDDTKSLSQRLSVTSFVSYIHFADTKLPVLKPFHYAVCVERRSGRRFQGISQGLRAVGETFGDFIHFHAGEQQLQVLSSFYRIWKQKTTHLSSKDVAPPTVSTNDSPSTIDLPFPTVAFHLPNDCVVALPHCQLQYTFDHSRMCISGSTGIDIDGKSIVNLTEGTIWTFDVIGTAFTVKNTMRNDLLAEATIHKSTLQRLAQGARMTLLRIALLDDIDPKGVPLWTADIQGNLIVSFLRDEESSVDAAVGPISINHEHYQLAKLDLHGQFQTGQFHLEIPSILCCSNAKSISVSNGIVAQSDSLETLDSLREHANSFIESCFMENTTEDKAMADVNVYIPFVMAIISEARPLKAQLQQIDVKALSGQLSVRSLSLSGEDVSVTAEGLKLETTTGGVVGTITTISSFNVQGIGKLHETFPTLSIRYGDGALELNLTDAHVVLAEELLSLESKKKEPVVLPTLPCSSLAIHLIDLVVSIPRDGIHQCSMTKAQFQFSQDQEERREIRCVSTEGFVWKFPKGQKFVVPYLPFRFGLDRYGNLLNGALESVTLEGFNTTGSNIISIMIPSISADFNLQELVASERGALSVILHSYDAAMSFVKECGFSGIENRTKHSPMNSLDKFRWILQTAQLAIQEPKPLAISIGHLAIDPTSAVSNTKLSANEVYVSLAGIGSFRTNKPLGVQVSYSDSGTEMQIGSIEAGLMITDIVDAVITVEDTIIKFTDEYVVQSFRCDGFDFESQMFAGFELSSPKFVYDSVLSELEVLGTIRCSIGSLKLAQAGVEGTVSAYDRLAIVTTELRTRSVSSSPVEILLKLKFPEIFVAVDEELMVLMEFRDLSVDTNGCVRLGSLVASTVNQERLELNGITAVISPERSLVEIESIVDLVIPGSVSLQNPVMNTVVEFTTLVGLVIKLNACEVSSLIAVAPKKKNNAGGSMYLPVRLSCTLQKLIIHSNEVVSTCNGLVVSVKQDSSERSGNVPCIAFQCRAETVRNDLVRLADARMHCSIVNQRLVEDLDITILSASVTSGFSTLQWSNILAPQQRASAPVNISLPNAHVSPIQVDVEHKGIVVTTEAKLRLPEFNGDGSSSLESLKSFYTKSVCAKMPTFFGNSKVLGVSVVDVGASSAGLAVVYSAVGGAVGGALGGTVGCAGGMIALDGITGAINSGKKARGVSDDDGYVFGDFTRGTVRAIKVAAKKGAAVRSDGQSRRYQFGDFSRGTSASLGTYADKNRERFGAAGGSTVGMIVGAAALGPLGLVAGAVAGSIAGVEALRKVACEKDDESATDNESAAQRSLPSTASDTLSAYPGPTPSVPVGDNFDLVASANDAFLSRQSHESMDISNAAFYSGPVPSAPVGDFSGSSDDPSLSGQSNGPMNDSFSFKKSSTAVAKPSSSTNQHPISVVHDDVQSLVSAPGPESPTPFSPTLQEPLPAQHCPEPQNKPGILQPPPQQRGYRFGDLTKSVIAKGKQSRGGSSNSGYKFGDFSRGLFG